MTDYTPAQLYWLHDNRAHVRAWNRFAAIRRGMKLPTVVDRNDSLQLRFWADGASRHIWDWLHHKAKLETKRKERIARAAAAAKEAEWQATIHAKEVAEVERKKRLARGWVDHRWWGKEDIHDIVDLPERRVVA